MAELLYQGHGSYRITTESGAVIYVDPYAGEGYEAPADLVLVTHGHYDHNKLSLVTLGPGATVITEKQALEGGRYNSFQAAGAQIEAVPAYNAKHDPASCVGYILTVDGVKLYASGDTSTTEAMKEMPARKLDYALLPIDGIFNMDAKEASACAYTIGARHSIPIHMKPGELFDRAIAETFDGPGRIIVEPGETIRL